MKVGLEDVTKAYQGETLVWGGGGPIYTALTIDYLIESAGTYDICAIEAAAEQQTILVDGVEVPSTTAITFTTTGVHTVEFSGIYQDIGNQAWFTEARSTIVGVHFPSTMSYVGQSAFWDCRKLEYADMTHTNIWAVNFNAFCGCNSLKEIKLSPLTRSIVGETFKDCWSVTSVTLNNIIDAIHQNAFYCLAKNVTGGIAFDVPASVKLIEGAAFYEANINNLTLHEGLETIGNNAFWNSNLSDLFLPSTVTSIGDGAFYGAISGYIELNEGLETIGDSAFFGCGASDLVIPSTVTSIGDRAFEDVGYETVKFMGATPPVMGDTIFGYVADHRPQVFYVPAASLQAYTTALTASYSGYTSHIVAY